MYEIFNETRRFFGLKTLRNKAGEVEKEQVIEISLGRGTIKLEINELGSLHIETNGDIYEVQMAPEPYKGINKTVLGKERKELLGSREWYILRPISDKSTGLFLKGDKGYKPLALSGEDAELLLSWINSQDTRTPLG